MIVKTKKRTIREIVEHCESLQESTDDMVVMELKKLKGKIGGIVSKLDGGGAKWSMDMQYRFNPVARRDGGVEVSMHIDGDYGYPIGEIDGDVIESIGYDIDLVVYEDKGKMVAEITAEPDLEDQKVIDVFFAVKQTNKARDLIRIISGVFDELDDEIPDMDEYDTDDEESRVFGKGGFGKWSNPSLFKR